MTRDRERERKFLRLWRAAFGRFLALVNPDPAGDPIAGPVLCGRCGAVAVYEFPAVLEEGPSTASDFYRVIRCRRCKETRHLFHDSFLGLAEEAKLLGDKLDPTSPAFVGRRLGPRELFRRLRGFDAD